MLVLLGHPSVIQGWAPILSGLGLLSGHGFKRLYLQLTWRVTCAGTTWPSTLLALSLGHRVPGIQGEDNSQWDYQESQACHWLT